MNNLGDVRPTSVGPDYPLGVIIHLIDGQIRYRGFHAGTGQTTAGTYANRQVALDLITILNWRTK